jgi:hypothetical protein
MVAKKKSCIRKANTETSLVSFSKKQETTLTLKSPNVSSTNACSMPVSRSTAWQLN